MSQLILYGLIGGLFSLIGGLILLWRADIARRLIMPLLAFAAGAFLSASLLDILPEALEMTEDPHSVMWAMLIGFCLFFILERWLMRYFFHSHNDSHQHTAHTETLPFLLILGDSLHNLLDGIIIAVTYVANPVLGLTTTLAVAAHEIPQEIGDFSILLGLGWKKSRVLIVNIIQSLLTIPGLFIGYYAGTALNVSLPYLLAGAAGTFLYLGASDLIPELHHQAGHKHFYRIVVPLLLGILMVGYLSALARH